MDIYIYIVIYIYIYLLISIKFKNFNFRYMFLLITIIAKFITCHIYHPIMIIMWIMILYDKFIDRWIYL